MVTPPDVYYDDANEVKQQNSTIPICFICHQPTRRIFAYVDMTGVKKKINLCRHCGAKVDLGLRLRKRK